MSIIKRHHSPRGLPLAWHQPVRERTILTVELSESPDLFLIAICGHVSGITRRQVAAYADHVRVPPADLWTGSAFNAHHFAPLADFLEALPCPISRQIVMGRWVLEGQVPPLERRRDGAGRRRPRGVWFPAGETRKIG
jgi:hypothetical protein